MSFVRLGNEYIKNGYTQVDNIFMLQYLPNCDALDAKIYLFGLSLANIGEENDNQIEKMALSLHISEQRIMTGYQYWEDKGIIAISKTNPPNIKYLSVKYPLTKTIKLNTQKYSQFVEEVERLFPDKILNQNEYNSIMETIELSHLEPDAMLLIMQYCCDLKHSNASTPYILAVANDWIKQGLLTMNQVDEHIQKLENNSEAIKTIFKALGIKRIAELEDRQIYLKWQKIYELDAILVACKALKRKGGMEKLDKYLGELQNAQAFTANEIKEYSNKKDELFALAVGITKNLGTYYGNLEVVIDTYIINWLNRGFEENALLRLAKFCFIRNIKSYDGLNQMVEAFYKKGLLSEQSIENYIARQILLDSKIRAVFDASDYYGTINGKDRSNYQTWIEWGFSEETIIYVASGNKDKSFPMQATGRVLSSLHARDIHDYEQVTKNVENATPSKGKKDSKNDDFMRHEYTDEQLKSVLVNVEDWQ
ncbi:MAG: DnaD domain protein [Clostridia bacterium]